MERPSRVTHSGSSAPPSSAKVGKRSEKSVSVDDERHAHPALEFRGLSPARLPAVHGTEQAAGGAVVGGENDDGPLAEFELVERIHQAAHQVVGVAHHGLVAVHPSLHLPLVRRGHERTVREAHGEIEHHGLLAVLLHEIDQEVAVEVGTEHPLADPALLADVYVGIPVALVAFRVAALATRPPGPFVEAVLVQRVRLQPEIVDLPLARDGGGVAGRPHHLGEGGVFFPVEVAHPPARHVPVVHPAGPPRVLARQQRHPRRGALRHGPGVVELHPAFRQRVDARGLDVVGAVAPDPVFPQVVDHDEEEVRRRFRFRAGGGSAKENHERNDDPDWRREWHGGHW